MIDAARIAAVGWLAFDLSLLEACARDNTAPDSALAHLTAAQARTMRAFAAQILPSENGLPGAEEAGAVHFVDRAMGLPYFADSVPVVHAGLADLDSRATASGARDGFASLSSAKQIQLMREIETTPFFSTARSLVVIGTLADPSYGGNLGGAGLKLLNIEHQPSYASPFGWYDAQSISPSAAAGA
ncbi:MAG: gluconate 2-dehydrogenase subunit 3 family protein [Gemmatimonadaceae bacterium]